MGGAKVAYQEGYMEVRMILRRQGDMRHRLALCCESLSTVPKLSWTKLFLLSIEKNIQRGTLDQEQ